MPVPIITNPMKLRQKLSESASPGPTPSYFGAGRALQSVANDKLVQHWLNSAEVGVSFLRYNRNGQVEKLVRITAGQQLNSGQQQCWWCSTLVGRGAHWCAPLVEGSDGAAASVGRDRAWRRRDNTLCASCNREEEERWACKTLSVPTPTHSCSSSNTLV